MNSLPTPVLGQLCSFLHVRAVVPLLELVLRRHDVRVPWSSLDRYVLYPPTRRLAILPGLRVLCIDIFSECILVIQTVLYAADRVETLVLNVLGTAQAALLADLVEPGPLPASEVRVELTMDDVDANVSLATFIRGFPLICELALDVRESWGRLALLDPAFVPASLRALEVTGWARLDCDAVKAVASCPLHRLVLDVVLDVGEPRMYEPLVDLRTLTELRLVAVEEVSQVAFVQHLPCLRSLALTFTSGASDCKLVLPPSVRELRCEGDYELESEFELDHGIEFASAGGGLFIAVLSFANLRRCKQGGLLNGVHTLSCEVWSVPGLADLLDGLTELRNLALINMGSDPLSGLAYQGSAFPVTALELTNLEGDDDLAWLGLVCPELIELEVQRKAGCGLTDSALAPLFFDCPKLVSLVDRSAETKGPVVTVGRRADGQLIKRKDDSSVVLVPQGSANSGQ